MKAITLAKLTLTISLLFSAATFAEVLLPIHNLRDQGPTDHCWAYSMSNILETRAQVRNSTQILINVEQDIKYWVDYERMMYIYRTKRNFFLGDYEGGWQIEFFETLLKHGKHLFNNSVQKTLIQYQPFQNYISSLKMSPLPRPRPDPTLESWYVIPDIMKTRFKTAQEAHEFTIQFLNRKYGKPQGNTRWSEKIIPVNITAKQILGADYVVNRSVDSIVLVKPTYDGQNGWTKYLENRYWGYRYDKNQVLKLVDQSLDNKWPVGFDNVSHAMTIQAYVLDPQGTKHYAVADSIGGKIVWYSGDELLKELNLMTFFRVAIPKALPAKTERYMLQLRLPMNKTLDQFDQVTRPPR